MNNECKSAKEILNLKPDIKYLIKIDEIFELSCDNEDLEVSKFMIELKPDLDVRFGNDKLFYTAVSFDDVEFAQFLVDKHPSIYFIEIADNGKEIINFHVMIISKEIKKEDIKKNIDDCYVCGDKSNIFTSCNHFYCQKCILNWVCKKDNSTCPYCRCLINTDNLFKIVD